MIIRKCINYNICNQLKVKNSTEYCYDCITYFNKKIKILKNINNNQCPICLDNNSELEIYKLEQCNHIICKECLVNIYFDKTYIKNIPKNPNTLLADKWNIFINSKRSNQMKRKVINKYLHSYYYVFDDIYSDLYIYNSNIYIPKIFKNEILELIHYQILLNKYLNENEQEKKQKRKYINICSYCRKSLIN